MGEWEMSKKLNDAAIWKKVKKAIDVESIGLTTAEWKKFCGRVEEHLTSQPESNRYVIHVDGASRNNPGPAGIGIVIADARGRTIRECSDFIGEQTNNVAEYRALIRALDLAEEVGAKELEIRTDSELMARQMNGIYRVKNIHLLNLYFEAQEKLRKFSDFTISQVPREENRRADVLANMAIDGRK
jgi:ribonuclease HI